MSFIERSPMSALSLRKLPPAERDATLSAAAELAADLYSSGADLEILEAFGSEDLHGESANTEARRDLAG